RAETPAVERAAHARVLDDAEREIGAEVGTSRVDGVRAAVVVAKHRDAPVPQLEGPYLAARERARSQRGIPRLRGGGRIREDAGLARLVDGDHWTLAAAPGAPAPPGRSPPPTTHSPCA